MIDTLFNDKLEISVIGGLLISSNQHDIISTLPVEAFANVKCRIVYEAMKELSDNATPIDILTVAQQLAATGNDKSIGGVTALTEYSMHIGNDNHLSAWCMELIDLLTRRQMVQLTMDINDAANSTKNGEELINRAKGWIEEIEQRNYKPNRLELSHISQVVTEAFTETANRKEIYERTGKKYFGISTGLDSINNRTGGWQSPDLIIIGARPAMGKTAFMLHLAKEAATDGNVLLFSLEMSKAQLATRLMGNASGVEYRRITRGTITNNEYEKITKDCDSLMDLNIYIDDTPSLRVEALSRNAKRVKKEVGLKAIFVDYLQLLTIEGKKSDNRTNEIGRISRYLKRIAKELEVPVIALSQLSRANETRGDKRPKLSDLREAGDIEQDADIVMFLHRPEYYGEMVDGNGGSTEGLVEVITAKMRNGETGTDYIKAELGLNTFSEWEGVPVVRVVPERKDYRKMFNDPF